MNGEAPARGARFWRASLATLVVIALGYVALGDALGTTGRLFYAAIEEEPASAKALLGARLLVGALLVGVGLRALFRGAAPRWARGLLLACLLAVTAHRYRATLHARPTGRLGPLLTIGMPGTHTRDASSHRAPRHYLLNEYGLRGPGFTLRPAPGVLRVAVVGDSYVFGLGVGEDETLPARLQTALPRPRDGRRLEVLNLGIPGNNIHSHITACGYAWSELGAELVVLVYHLPNDFSRWDAQDERRDEGRVSAYSVLNYFVGREIGTMLVTRFIVDGGGLAAFPPPDQQLEVLVEAIARLDRVQGGRGLIVVPMEFVAVPGAVERFARRPSTVVTRRFGFEPALLIPVDGHPNAEGYTAFAQAVREAGARLPQWATWFP